jgi:hypothetical protein
MDFDWKDSSLKVGDDLSFQGIEESFEDPFAVRLLPDSPRFEQNARFFNLGRTSSGSGVFSVYRTNGKMVRVLGARLFEPEETFFYKRRMKQLLD